MPPEYQSHESQYFSAVLMQWTGIAILYGSAGRSCYGGDGYSFRPCKAEVGADATFGREVLVANESLLTSA